MQESYDWLPNGAKVVLSKLARRTEFVGLDDKITDEVPVLVVLMENRFQVYLADTRELIFDTFLLSPGNS